MNTRKSLVDILYYVSITASGIIGLITAYLFCMVLLSLVGLLPQNFDASFEVPIRLEKAERFYIPESHSDKFTSTHIEVKKANLEVLPTIRTWPQALAYFHASLYVGFYFLILVLVIKILNTFRKGDPFDLANIRRVVRIGWLTIGLGVYEYLIVAAVAFLFRDMFTISNGSMIQYPGFWDINFATLFIGSVVVVLANAFRRGRELQDLEDQTV